MPPAAFGGPGSSVCQLPSAVAAQGLLHSNRRGRNWALPFCLRAPAQNAIPLRALSVAPYADLVDGARHRERVSSNLRFEAARTACVGLQAAH